MRTLGKVQIRLMDSTRGRLLGRMGGNPLLILTTTGWRTGQEFSNPVVGIADGDDWLIVASHGGAAINPRWLRNIARNPQVKVRRGGRKPTSMVARILPGDERDEWWPKLTEAYPAYAKMQGKTDRKLAVVRLSPAQR